MVLTYSAGQGLLETIAAHLLLHGNAYIQILADQAGQPYELFALRPDRVTVKVDTNGWPLHYEYRVSENVQNIDVTDEAGRPSGALVYDGGDNAVPLSDEQFDRLRHEMEASFTGSGNAGRPMLLEGGLSWQAMSMSPADMDFVALKAAAARDIALAFGVPPMLLGLPGDNSYANYREANRALWRLTLLPMLTKILTAISQGLSGGIVSWIDEVSIEVDLDKITALSEDRERLWAQVSAAEFLTDDEKRALLGLNIKGEGDA